MSSFVSCGISLVHERYLSVSYFSVRVRRLLQSLLSVLARIYVLELRKCPTFPSLGFHRYLELLKFFANHFTDNLSLFLSLSELLVPVKPTDSPSTFSVAYLLFSLAGQGWKSEGKSKAVSGLSKSCCWVQLSKKKFFFFFLYSSHRGRVELSERAFAAGWKSFVPSISDRLLARSFETRLPWPELSSGISRL